MDWYVVVFIRRPVLSVAVIVVALAISVTSGSPRMPTVDLTPVPLPLAILTVYTFPPPLGPAQVLAAAVTEGIKLPKIAVAPKTVALLIWRSPDIG